MENSYENKICEAIEYIVKQAVETAPYDKTIQATIVKCVDSTIGQYQVKYQDSKFYAYATSSEVSYSNNALVYVLIPSNDMSRDKTILGTVEKLGVDYAVNPEGDEAYEVVGKNCVNNTNTIFEMCSYNTGRYEYVLYDKNNHINRININTKDLQEYITKSSSLICGGIFKTSLPKEQRFRGNYGILFELTFLDNASEELVNRDYIVDVNQMTGNPYNLNTDTRQYGIFEVDGANFQYLNKVLIFCYDFPNTANNKPNDIFIKNIEISGATRMSSEELSGCALALITPNGIYFDTTDANTAKRKIQAQVRVKGKVIDKNSQNLKYYWFKENLGITTLSEKYNKYGGQGWECLNNYNVIKQPTLTEDRVVEWVPAEYELTVEKRNNIAKKNKYKCAVVYNNDTILVKEIDIINYSSNYNITIESDSGNQFYYDIGNPTLTCKVNNVSTPIQNYTYVWAEVNNNNNYMSLPETIAENLQYNNAVTSYNNLLQQIANETKLPAASQSKLNEYKQIIDSYETITRVEKNKVYKVKISEITSFSTFKCAVYNNGVYLGTAEIVLTNDLEKKDAYSLVINNGSQVFKYDEAGIAPTSKSLDKPMIIEPLSFVLYDNLGNKIDDEILRKCKIKWVVPTENTLISIPSSYIANRTEVDLINHTETYSNLLGISYTISERYNIKYTNNNIKLIVEYKEMNLATQTDFTFVKEGEPGTNGTEFVCKIVPNIAENNAPLYPMIFNGNLNYTPRQSNKWFRVQLWHNGINIFEGYQTGNSSEGKSVAVVWSILKNKYTTTVSDNSDITINSSNGTCSYTGYQNGGIPANIIKCSITYDGVNYYATMPIITGKANSGYSIKLKDYTGFRYALYTSDGRSPQYDNSQPFELEVLQNINGYNENVSELTSTYAVNYNWIVRGKIYNSGTEEWELKNYLVTRSSSGLKRNQKSYKPIDKYDGECLNNGLECIISRGGNELGRIHIPIHFLLNKYGNAAINGWDGNSVSIDKNGSGVILAPQIGAGQKENDNSFTGIVMGKVKESGKSSADIGLFGYKAGARTIFLNSEDGSAIFGKSDKGQIIIDPNANKALLYSSNYWKEYNEKGKPKNYSSTNENGQGLLIDLTTPQIKFGNGNFSVNSSGHLVAKGGGTIAGWNIGDTALTKGKVGISSNNSSDSNYAFWAGNTTASNAPFSVTFGGYLKAYEATIGSGTNKITIGKNSLDSNISAIYSGSKTYMSAETNGFYIGTNGFALGRYSNGHSPFEVESDGTLFSKSGTIGGFTIDDHSLTSGSGAYITGMSSSGAHHAFWAGGEEYNAAKFKVGHDGHLYASDVDLTGKITATSGSFSGSIEAGTGHIGGWIIGTNYLQSAHMILYSNGYIDGNGWYITEGGYAHFTDISISNGQGRGTIDWGNGFSVDNSGTMTANGANFSGSITGNSSISINDGTHYLEMGYGTAHPEVSGLNVTGSSGIQMNGHGLDQVGTITTLDNGLYYTGESHSTIGIRDGNGGVHYFLFKNGLMVNWSYSAPGS